VRRRAVLPEGGRPVRVVAADGVELSGVVVPSRAAPVPGQRPVTFVVAHGFTNSVTYPAFARLVGWLSRFGEVRALDFRGHGSSGGGSAAGGDPEALDVDAAVAAARADGARTVVTVGLSMGGGAVLRQAAAGVHRPDAVVSISAVSRWYVRDTGPMQRVHWLLETTPGRRLGAAALRLRLDVPWLTVPPSPLQLVNRIAPTPLLLVHGDEDSYFPLEHFRTLARAAGPAATVWVEPGMGHAETGTTAALAERIGRWVRAAVDALPDPLPDPTSSVPATSGGGTAPSVTIRG
jgi:uncharacterized protein